MKLIILLILSLFVLGCVDDSRCVKWDTSYLCQKEVPCYNNVTIWVQDNYTGDNLLSGLPNKPGTLRCPGKTSIDVQENKSLNSTLYQPHYSNGTIQVTLKQKTTNGCVRYNDTSVCSRWE
tara:strand:- start:383 stop:745 length:363 start_codon:yes stop_codon:yes gene_type:complete